MTEKVVAIIPARGGSKRIPRKNIKNFLGVPMLARTIDTLKCSRLFQKIIVSTDDSEIASVAIGAGAEVPFLRDPQLADDYTPTAPVIADTLIRYASENNVEFDLCCCVYPCNPILTIETIAQAKLLRKQVQIRFSSM